MDIISMGRISKLQTELDNLSINNYPPLYWFSNIAADPNNLLPRNMQAGSDYTEDATSWLKSIGTEVFTGGDVGQGPMPGQSALKVVTAATLYSGAQYGGYGMTILPDTQYTLRTLVKGSNTPFQLWLMQYDSSHGSSGANAHSSITTLGSGYQEIKTSITTGSTAVTLNPAWYIGTATASTFWIGPSILRVSIPGIDI